MVNLTPKKILIQPMKKFLSSGKFKSNHVKGTLSKKNFTGAFYIPLKIVWGVELAQLP